MLEEIIPNFRDLGGLPASDGRLLLSRRLIRTSALVQKAKPVTAVLREYLPRAVYIDLRTEGEIERDGVPVSLRGWRRLHLPLYDVDLGQPIKREHLPEAFRRYKRIVARIASEARESPVVIACSLGKDRTGFTIALLLHWLGVPRKEILRDYTLSNERLITLRHRLPMRWQKKENLITRVHARRCGAWLDFAQAKQAGPPRAVAALRRVLIDHTA